MQISEETDTQGLSTKAAEAHKKLAEVHSKDGNVTAAKQHLTSLLEISIRDGNKAAQAEAYLKMGLLEYQLKNIKRSVEMLKKHFDFSRVDSGENET